MNPLQIFEKEPLDRSRLNWFTRIIVFFIEWIARFLASIYLSVILLILGILPSRKFSKTFIRVLYAFCNLYMMRWMPEELKQNGTTDEPETMEQTNGREIPKVERSQ